MDEYREAKEALEALHVAENHFAFADAEHVETALLELDAAQRRLAAALCKLKANGEKMR